MNNITEVDLKTFLNAKNHLTDNYISMTLNNIDKTMSLIKVMKEKNKYGSTMEYRLKTVIPLKIYYHDFDHEKEFSLNLNKKENVEFFLSWDSASNMLFALEFFSRVKNAELVIDYYPFNASQNDIERGYNAELIKIDIKTKKDCFSMYINHHYVYDSCALRRI